MLGVSLILKSSITQFLMNIDKDVQCGLVIKDSCNYYASRNCVKEDASELEKE